MSYLRPLVFCLSLFMLVGCNSTLSNFPGLSGLGSQPQQPPQNVGQASSPQVVQSSGSTIGKGTVRVGLVLPLSAPGQGGMAGIALRNAAELALTEFQNPELTLLVKDDRGTPEGAREATQQALSEGAEIIIGPLYAGSVQAAGQVARSAGRPVIAFSSDANVAGRGIYLLSFLPQAEVDRIVDYAISQGRRSFAALIPEGAYGAVAEARFREVAARRGVRIAAIERYPAGQPHNGVARLASVMSGANPQIDALFLPDNGDSLNGVGQALQASKFNSQRIKVLGTGAWNDPRVFRVASLQGGWFAAPESNGYAGFAARYQAKFGSEPVRVATLAYDAISLTAALVRTQGSQRFSENVLTSSSGFAGADGVFRFRNDGLNERGLGVFEIRNGSTSIISPAPKALGGSGT